MREMRYELRPRDVLFFRDGRPMDIDKKRRDVRNIGHGAVWPRPDHLYKGVMHALIRETDGAGFGDFPSVKVVGPYPLKHEAKGSDTLYLPRPNDWDTIIERCVDTDLPEPLEYAFIDRVDGKKKYPAWIKCEDYAKYLRGEDHGLYDEEEAAMDDKGGKTTRKTVKFPYADGSIFGVEPRVGTTLDYVTGASKRVKGQHASGQHQGEYLRLQKGVSMWCAVETGKIGMSELAPEAPEAPRAFLLGGQGGVVTRSATDIDLAKMFPRPEVDGDGEVFVRWTLLAPAFFSMTGWLPGWCKDSRRCPADPKVLGTVMFAGCGGCKLVGACMGKPVFFSGWDPQTDGAKPTILVVPQGSVYLFRCNDRANAESLIEKLHFRRQSDLGSQGFGIGVCSIVKLDSSNK